MKPEPLKNKYCNNFDRNKFSVREGHTKLFEEKHIKSAVEWLYFEQNKRALELLNVLEYHTRIGKENYLSIRKILYDLINKKDKAFEDVTKTKRR